MAWHILSVKFYTKGKERATKKFEKGFLIGTSTAAHQVEGNNTHSDCWVMENIPHTIYADRSGDAVDHYNRYEEDIRLMAASGFNAYRFSIEWARIEPQEGVFDAGEVEHYRKVIICCKENGLEPMIVLHHFSSPAWLISKGGWENEAVIGWFVRYCRYVMERLGSEVRFVCTINEANIRLQMADIMKRYARAAQSSQQAAKDAESSLQMGMNFQAMMELQKVIGTETAQAFGLSDPQGVHNFQTPCTEAGDLIICRTHAAARNAIKEICPDAQVGLSISLHDFQAQSGGGKMAEKEWDKEFRHYLPYIKDDDYLGMWICTIEHFS